MSEPIIGTLTSSCLCGAGTNTPVARLQHLEVPKTTVPSAVSCKFRGPLGFHNSLEGLRELRKPYPRGCGLLQGEDVD